MDGDDDSHAGDGYTTPDGIGDISSIAQFMQGLAVQTRPTSNRLEWDGNQEGWKDFWFRFESHVCVSKNIKSEVLDPEHTPSTAARVKLYHELVGLLTTPASGKPSKALQILKGFKQFKGECAHDGFGALHAIIAAYDQRHESDAMQVEEALRSAMQKDDEDVDDWQLRLEDLNITAQQQDIHLCDKRLKLGLVRGLRPEYNILRLQLAKAGTMRIDELMDLLRNGQNVMKQSGQLTNRGHKLPAAAPEIGGALYYTETSGGGDCTGAGGSAETRICWACGKPGHIVPNCPNQAAKDKYALEHPRHNRKPAATATPDGEHGGGKRKGACVFCDQHGHHISTCAVKKAFVAGKQVGMVNGTMQVLATSAHEQLPLADAAGPYELLLEDLEEGIQDFDINAFFVTAVQEKRTPEITTNGRARTHPYDVLNAGLNALDAVGDQGHGTEVSDQRAVQAASYTVENEDQCQLCSAQAEAAVDARAQSTLRKLQRDNAGLQAQLVESREREAALVQMLQGHSTELQRVTTFTGGAESTDACGVKAVTPLGVPGEPAETAGVLSELVEMAGILGGLVEAAGVQGEPPKTAGILGELAETASVPGKMAEMPSARGELAETVVVLKELATTVGDPWGLVQNQVESRDTG